MLLFAKILVSGKIFLDNTNKNNTKKKKICILDFESFESFERKPHKVSLKSENYISIYV